LFGYPCRDARWLSASMHFATFRELPVDATERLVIHRTAFRSAKFINRALSLRSS